MEVSEIWHRLSTIASEAKSKELKDRCKYSLDELFNGRVDTAIKLIEALDNPIKDTVLVRFIAAMNGKRFMKGLRESKDSMNIIQSLYSYGAHLAIEAQLSNVDVSMHLDNVNEQIAVVRSTGALSETFKKNYL